MEQPDYIPDIVYTLGYYGVINPVSIRFALLVRGVVPCESQRVLELGYGQGLSLVIHGAAGDGEHWGIDFNAAHAATAQDLVAAAGGGIHALEASFQEMLARDDIPQFDVITLHGIYSWVSPENRHAIVEILRRHLSPGGACYISYNCWPGWAASTPLRHLFKLHASTVGASRSFLQQIQDSLAFAGTVEAAGARYFKTVPEASRRLKQLAGKDRRYLAHEFLNSEWTPMPFDRVADDLRAAKLDFACSAHLLDQVDSLNLTKAMRELLAGIEQPILRETVRDFCVNQQFRRDLFVRGLRPLNAFEFETRMLHERVVLIAAPDEVSLEVQTGLGKAKLDKAVYTPLIETLADDDGRPRTLGELLADSRLKVLSFHQLAQAIAVLCGAGAAHPAQSDAVVDAAAPRCHRLNRAIISRSGGGSDIHHLASPVTGGGVAVSRVQQMFLDALLAGRTEPAAWAAYTWPQLKQQGHRLKKDDRPLQTDEENLTELTRQAGQFADSRLPVLRRLRCLA